MNWHEPQTLEEAIKLCHIVIKSRILPGIQNVDQAIAIALAGAELGMGLMSSLRAFHVMSGRAVIASQTLVAIAQRSPECISFVCVETTERSATFEAQRRGGKPVRRTFAMADAERAGLLRNPTWKKFPKAMLRWRCASSLARDLFADVLGGFVAIESAPPVEVNPPAPLPTPPTPLPSTPPKAKTATQVIPTNAPKEVLQVAAKKEEISTRQQFFIDGLASHDSWQESARAAVELLVAEGVFSDSEEARAALASKIKGLSGSPNKGHISTFCFQLEQGNKEQKMAA